MEQWIVLGESNDIILRIVDDQLAEESLGSAVSLGILTALLSAAGMVEGATFNRNIRQITGSRGATQTLTLTKSQLGKAVQKSATSQEMVGSWQRTEALNVVARTLWMEARGEGNSGLNMVATVIWNRAGGVAEQMVPTCLAEKQFSCWNDIRNKSSSTYSIQFPVGAMKGGKETEIWKRCCSLAEQMVDGTFKPVNDTWNAYYNPDTVKKIPSWDSDLLGSSMVGNHKVGQLKWLTNKANKLKASSSTVAQAAKTHVVKPGDTLYSIARANNIKVDRLKQLNGINSDTIRLGQTLKVG